jgi:ubiquinone/menaquinone biosynthesis C-methylase UbiE
MQNGSYTPGYSVPVLTFMEQRTAESHAGFFLPQLLPGWRVLDAGCGPGTITIGLARKVSPGPVIGIDIEESQFAKAREQAEQEGLNIEFQTANISHLPFGDGYFDAVFSHAVLQHLTDPDAALTELRRVLKPGGLIGVRAGDMGGTLVDSEGEEAAQGLAAYLAKSEKGGGDPYIGRKLGRLLRKAGFMVEGVSASYEVITETLRHIGPSLAAQFAVAEKERVLDAENDLPFVALAWCEVCQASYRTRPIAVCKQKG